MSSQLSIGSPSFWHEVNKSFNGKRLASLKDRTIIYVVFNDDVKMEPFVRTDEVMFTSLATDLSKKNNYLAVINAQVYGISKMGMMDYAIGDDPVDPEYVEPEGLVIRGRKIIAGRAAPLNFHIAYYPGQTPPYRFNFGAAPTTAGAAIGGAGPLIINGLPYGPVNRYKAGAPKGKPRGKPTPENAKNLTQRSNATFSAFANHSAAPKTGITAIAHCKKENKLALFIHPNNSGDLPLSTLRNKLVAAGFDNAIFLDGSDSSMLMVDNKMLASPGLSKDKTNNIGIGFKY